MTAAKPENYREPEVVEGLSEIVIKTLSEQLDIPEKKAQKIASEIAFEFCDLYGGLQVYLAKGLRRQLDARDRKIYAEFDGYNHETLAKKHRVSVRWIYYLVRRMEAHLKTNRKREVDEKRSGQTRLL